MKSSTPVLPREFTGRHMAFIMIAFFTVVVGVNVTMATLARTSWTGLIVPNAYVASQRFNAETDRRQAMLATGHRLNLSYVGGKLSIALKHQSGDDLAINHGTVTLGRGVSSQHDVTHDLICAKSACEVTIPLPPGIWRGEVKLQSAGLGLWQQPIEITVKEP